MVTYCYVPPPTIQMKLISVISCLVASLLDISFTLLPSDCIP